MIGEAIERTGRAKYAGSPIAEVILEQKSALCRVCFAVDDSQGA
jgi:hypothetical protein